MHLGLTIFPTDYSIPLPELALEAEQRGFESLWVAEHSHIPTSRKSPWPGGGDLPKMNRPPDTWSIEATSFAVWIVSRWITRQTPVASFSRLVTTAAAVNVTKGSMTS